MATNNTTFAARAAYVSSISVGDTMKASVAGVCASGLIVNLTENAPMTALTLGLNQNERDIVKQAIDNKQSISLEVTVIEASSNSKDDNGNLRCRLVTRISINQAAELAKIAAASFKAGDSFNGRPVKLITNDRGVIGLILKDGRVTAFLHASQTTGGYKALEQMHSSDNSVNLTVLSVNDGRIQLTQRSSSFIANLKNLAARVGQEISCHITNGKLKQGRIQVEAMGIDTSLELGDVKLADGQSRVKATVDSVDTTTGRVNLSIVKPSDSSHSRAKQDSRKASRRMRDQEIRNNMRGTSSGGKGGKGGK